MPRIAPSSARFRSRAALLVIAVIRDPHRWFASAVAMLAVTFASSPQGHAQELVFADGFEFGGTCAWSSGSQIGPGPVRNFCVRSPDVDLLPGQGITYCYYFRTPNTETVGIRRWLSEMTAGTHHLILYATRGADGEPADRQPPGTLTQSPCGLLDDGGGTTASWVYAAHDALAQLEVPGDDGAGTPLAIEVAPDQSAFLQMQFLNTSDQPVTARVTVGAEALDTGVAYTRTDTYLTFNGSINIPPAAVGDVESRTCDTPAGAEFWWLSTHTHKYAVYSEVKDGSNVVFATSDWEHPGASTFAAPSFLSFATGELTYACTYNNPGNTTITTGDSSETDENCVAIGYFFPAMRPLFCYDNIGPL